jgi:hypothetical protein
MLAEVSRRTVLQSYRLLFLTKYVTGLLEENGIPSVVLKGAATAQFYPVPELRKSGDVDLLIGGNADMDRVQRIMEEAHFRIAEKQHANHHLICKSPDGIDVELHVMISEPFSYESINRYLERNTELFCRHSSRQDLMGVMLPVLDRPYHAFQLLLHMLQHFLYAGFGLKLLCDWVMIWNQPWQEQEKSCFLHLTEESGTRKFAEVITSVCVQYLGLAGENVDFFSVDPAAAESFMEEIMEAEEFGKSSRDRMVMMSGSGIPDYLREFQHQMHLNYPRAGRNALCWPVLWVLTLARFLHNNRTIRRVSAFSVLRKAGKRSRLMEHLELFERK